MPALQRGSVRTLPSGKVQLRYYDADGNRKNGGVFKNKSAAFKHYRDVIEPKLDGTIVDLPDLTLAQFVDLYLERHGAVVEDTWIETLRYRLARPLNVYGDVKLRELERMSGELASFRTTLPPRFAYAVMSALRQTLAAAVRWGYCDQNAAVLAGKNPQPPPVEIQPFTFAELDLLAAEFGDDDHPNPLIDFCADTGLRCEEWIPLERRDVDLAAGVVHVQRTAVDGVLKQYGKTSRFRRRVPLTSRATAAFEAIVPRIDTPLLFPAPQGGYIDLRNWRRREWQPALVAAGLAVCTCGHGSDMHDDELRVCERAGCRCRTFKLDTRRGVNRTPYALRHTYATNMLAAGVPAFDLARYMGTSLEMLSRTYGHLIEGSEVFARERMDALAGRLGHEWGTNAASGTDG